MERGVVESDSSGHYRLRPIVQPQTRKEQGPGEAPRPLKKLTGASRKILFVDDEEHWRDHLSVCLHDFEYKVLASSSANGGTITVSGNWVFYPRWRHPRPDLPVAVQRQPGPCKLARPGGRLSYAGRHRLVYLHGYTARRDHRALLSHRASINLWTKARTLFERHLVGLAGFALLEAQWPCPTAKDRCFYCRARPQERTDWLGLLAVSVPPLG